MKTKLLLNTFLLVLLSCAQVTSLNLKKHQFGKIPTKIIWIQVAGLSLEHFSMLKYSYPSRKQLTPFEESLCIGSAWEYNLYDLRPDAYAGFLSQLSGKKNIKNSCDDFTQKPIWKYVASKGYRVGIFEGEMNKNKSLIKSQSCENDSNYLAGTTLWSMNKTKSKLAKYFHVNEKNNFSENEIYYDKSCRNGNCFSTFSRNIEGVFNDFSKNSKNYIFLVRNFKFKEYLLKRNIKEARQELEQIAKTLKKFQDLSKKNNDTLVLLTSAESYEVDFPKAGISWKKFENLRAKLNVKNSKLLAPVLATGARAENFCGMYDQSQIMARIFSGAKQQGLEFSIINPFN